jgi:hypothetical protein
VTAILQQLALKHREHTSMSVGLCKRLDLPVPQRRAADRERADVAIEEIFSLHLVRPPSTTRRGLQIEYAFC